MQWKTIIYSFPALFIAIHYLKLFLSRVHLCCSMYHSALARYGCQQAVATIVVVRHHLPGQKLSNRFDTPVIVQPDTLLGGYAVRGYTIVRNKSP